MINVRHWPVLDRNLGVDIGVYPIGVALVFFAGLAVLVAAGAVSAMGVGLTIFLATIYGAAPALIPLGIVSALGIGLVAASWLIRGFCEGNSNLPQGDNPH